MRPFLRRILRPLRPPSRLLMQLSLSRPQLPFLFQPRQHTRFLTTERRQWLKQEILKAGKFTALLWTSGVLLFIMAVGVQQEWLERQFPSPHEWSLLSRINFRSIVGEEARAEEDNEPVDWPYMAQLYRNLLARLEDPGIDGAGLTEQDDGGILVAGVGRTGFDVLDKPEPWRRGYHKVLMGCALGAEKLDSWVIDKSRNITFPADTVRGPSNPRPRPVPPGSPHAPREEDCEPAFETPETYYMRVLTTRGFTDEQKLEAALGEAAWLDYKGAPGAALEMYRWALEIATAAAPNRETLFNSLGAINANSGPISSNVLNATTALALHHARKSDLSTALPIFLSVLRARRSLAPEKATIGSTLTHGEDEDHDSIIMRAAHFVRDILTPPIYPPPPDSGALPPVRDVKERCEEAAVMAYIGEILYAASAGIGPTTDRTRASREDGLAWTREAVDVAEEELRGLVGSKNKRRPSPSKKDATMTCRECLETALGNWETMVARLAREEREQREMRMREQAGQKSKISISGWLGLGGAERKEELEGRWEAEMQVVRERDTRAAELLQKGGQGGKSWLSFM